MFQIVLAITFGSLVFHMEVGGPNNEIKTIPEGIWFAIITMTTVGYGDVVPVTRKVYHFSSGVCVSVINSTRVVQIFVISFKYILPFTLNTPVFAR
jgi:hypothetical protein